MVPVLDPLAQSDREDELTEWLENHGIEDGWDLSPTLVSAGFDRERLEELTRDVPAEELGIGEGTGLGLDIACRIVQVRHKGTLRFESRPGETTFEVRLPIQAPAE